MQPSKEGSLSARGVHHRTRDYFVNQIITCTNQLVHTSRSSKKTLAQGNIYFSRAQAFATLGNHERAIRDYTSCIDIFLAHKQQCSVVYFNRSLLKYHAGDVDAALVDINKAIEQDHSNITFFKNRALFLRKKNDFLRCTTDVRLIEKLEKKNHDQMEAKRRRKSSTLRRLSLSQTVHRTKQAASSGAIPTTPLLLAGGAASSSSSDPNKANVSHSHDSDGIIPALEKEGKMRSKLEKRKIAETISHFDFFKMLADDHKALEDLCGKISLKTFKPNEYIFKQGDQGDVFYVLYEGAVSITTFVSSPIRGEKDIEKVLKLLHKGDTFGETALKTGDGRGANAKCTQSSLLIIIECEDFLAIEREHEVFLREQKLSMVRRCPAFSDFTVNQLTQIVQKMDVKRYDAQTVITSRGDKAPDLCLIRKGMVKVLKSTPLDLCETPNIDSRLDNLDEKILEESPGIWVIQRNWREVMEPKRKNMTMAETLEAERDNHDFTVGVLGSGEFFGELAVLDESEFSPVTVIACTNVELFCLSHDDVVNLQLHINHNLKRCLEESMVMHNPPAHKVAHFFRSKVKWEVKKDKILETCMSEKWIQGKKKSNEVKKVMRHADSDLEYQRFINVGTNMTVKKTQDSSKKSKSKKVNPKLLMHQFSLTNMNSTRRMQF